MFTLIVDGDAGRRSSTFAILSKRGHFPMTAANRTDAMEILRRLRVKPRMILLDPECGGESATNFLSVILEVAPTAKILLLDHGYHRLVPALGAE